MQVFVDVFVFVFFSMSHPLEQQNPQYDNFSLINTRSRLLIAIRVSICITKSQIVIIIIIIIIISLEPNLMTSKDFLFFSFFFIMEKNRFFVTIHYNCKSNECIFHLFYFFHFEENKKYKYKNCLENSLINIHWQI